MRVERQGETIKLWLSASDTYNWAHKTGAGWPCSYLSGKRLFAEFDAGGLVDCAVNGEFDGNLPVDEFNAITDDAMMLSGSEYYE